MRQRGVNRHAAGIIDRIPANVFTARPKLDRVYAAANEHAGVEAWHAE